MALFRSDRLIERSKKCIRLLGTGQGELAVDDEKWHTVHAKQSRESLGLLDRLQPVVALQYIIGLELNRSAVGWFFTSRPAPCLPVIVTIHRLIQLCPAVGRLAITHG
jgi:hypothetical protein